MSGFHIEKTPGGAIFHVDNPSRRNALQTTMWDALDACIDELEQSEYPFLVITGAGDIAFSSGTDLTELASPASPDASDKNDRVRNLLFKLSRSKVITIAAVNGLAYGGGCELAMACTFRIAAPSATFCLPEIKLGLLPTYGGTQFLPALVGRSRALDLLLTARVLNADEALGMGLVNRVAANDQALMDDVEAFVAQLRGMRRVAVQGLREAVSAASEIVTREGLDVESSIARAVLQSEDASEGVSAFLQKREPKFNGM